MRREESVTVQKFTARVGQIGQKVYDVPDGPPVSVPCNAYALEAALVDSLGLQRKVTRKLFVDSWPGDEFCRITYDGDEWDQVAEAEPFKKTSRPFLTVIIRRR